MNIEVRRPEPHNVYAMKKMWEMCFGDNEEYINLFFDNCFNIEQALVAFCDMKPAGMLFMLPVKLKLGEKIYHGNYLYAVCTKQPFRKMGVMRCLITAAGKVSIANKMDFMCLVPANESLFKMYEKFDFKATFYLSEKNILAFPEAKIDGVQMHVCSKEDYLRMRLQFLFAKNAYVDFEPPFDEYRYLEFKKAGGNIYNIKIDGGEYYLAGQALNDNYIIRETTLDSDKLQRVLPLIANEKQISFFKARGLTGHIDKINQYAMMKWINPQVNANLVKSLRPYINLMLD